MNTSGKENTFHIESETKSGTLSIEIKDLEDNILFSESDMKDQAFDITVSGKIRVTILADKHKGGFSIKQQ